MPEPYHDSPSHHQQHMDTPFLASFTHKIQLLVMETGTTECNLQHRLIVNAGSHFVLFFPPPSTFGASPSHFYGGSSGPQFSSYGGAPFQIFGTSTMTPSSAYRRPSSSQQDYRLEIPFHASHEGSQSVEMEETDDERKSPPPPPQPER